MSDPRANIELTASSGKLSSGLRSAAGMVKGFAAGVRKSMKFAGGTAMGTFAGGLAQRGVDLFTDQAKGVMEFEKNLSRLGIAGNLNTTKLDELRKAARANSSEFGIGADQILAGTQAYVDLTGDVEGAAGSMSTFTRIAQASGSSVADIATASAAFKGIGIPLKDLEATFSGMITQGKAGAVSLKDFAGELAGLAPRWAKFNESTNADGIAQLGAAFQVARQGFGSASEAATGLQALMGALTQNAKKFEKAGAKIFDTHKDGSKTLKAFEEILSSIEKSKLIKDPTLMTKALGSKEAEQTLTMLMKSRTVIGDNVSEYSKLVTAGGDAKAVQRDLATYMESSSGQMDKAWETVKNKIAEAMTPARIKAFADMIKDAVSNVDGLIAALNKVGNFLGKISSVGKKIRGAISGTNPYGGDGFGWMEDDKNKLLDIAGMDDGAEKEKAKKDFGQMIANRAMYKATSEKIMGAEVGEAASPQSLKLARDASWSAVPAIRDTGGSYLQQAGEDTPRAQFYNAISQTTKAADDAVGKLMTDAIAKGFALAAKSMGIGTDIKIGNEVVAKASDKSTTPRRGGQ